MIVCVCLNPAIDVTYRLPSLRIGETNRLEGRGQRAGGKALNVARVAASLGHATRVVAPLGGAAGAWIENDLRAAGVELTAIPTVDESRFTITLVSEDGTTTGLSERGPHLDQREQQRTRDVVSRALNDASVLVISGSVPPGVSSSFVGDLVSVARSMSVPVIVDTTGEALVAAAAAGADVIKPNRIELAEATGADTWLGGALQLLRSGARLVVASLDSDGLAAVSSHGCALYTGRALEPVNTTGAGDAVVAALAAAFLNGSLTDEDFVTACAMGAAAVLQPLAGEVNPNDVAEIRQTVERKELI